MNVTVPISSLKKPYEMAVKKSVSMPGIMFDQADLRRRGRQFATFSDYLQDLIRKDLSEPRAA